MGGPWGHLGYKSGQQVVRGRPNRRPGLVFVGGRFLAFFEAVLEHIFELSQFTHVEVSLLQKRNS